jgi:hypothetical protein
LIWVYDCVMSLNYFCSIIIDYLNYENENLDCRNQIEWLTPSQSLNLPLLEDLSPFKLLAHRTSKQLELTVPPERLTRSSLLNFAGHPAGKVPSKHKSSSVCQWGSVRLSATTAAASDEHPRGGRCSFLTGDRRRHSARS